MGKVRKALLVVPQGGEQAGSESVTTGVLQPRMPNTDVPPGVLGAQEDKLSSIWSEPQLLLHPPLAFISSNIKALTGCL